jgi:hypothetical protein
VKDEAVLCAQVANLCHWLEDIEESCDAAAREAVINVAMKMRCPEHWKEMLKNIAGADRLVSRLKDSKVVALIAQYDGGACNS